ncbi:MAG TPA: invasin domain 3-containing protein [Gaiellaceae bacterium]
MSAAGASTLSVSAPASATAGSAFSVTVTALDAYGNTATGYTGTIHFTGGGTSPTLPSNYTFTGGDNGVHTFTTGVTLTQAGSRTVTATDTVTGSITGTSSTISVSAAGASTLAVSAPASATAGTAFSVTVTALDVYGNTATGYTGTVHFTGGGTGATLPSNYTFTGGDNGVHTFTTGVTLTQAGSRTVTATDTVTGSITGTSSSISVSAAGASTLAVSAPASATAGSAFSVTVPALDAYGNTATGYTGTVHFTGGGAGATLPSNYTFTGGDNGTHTFTNAFVLTQAGSRTVTATDTVTGSITGTSSTIAVSAAGASTLTVSAPASATAGSAFSVTVTALDAYGNTATGYTGTIHFTGGGTSPTLPSNYIFTGGDNGTHTFSNAFMLTQAGSRTITATDTVTGSITGTSSSISVSPAGAASLAVTAPASVAAGGAFSVTVTALDPYGNTATGYTGTIHFTGGGTGATLPSDYAFTGGDNGAHTFTNGVTLTQSGSRTITATDTNTGSITGTSSTITVGASASQLVVTAPASATAGSAFSVTVTAKDSFGNVAAGYTGTVHFTGGGTGATLPSDYTFVAGDNGTHTFSNGATLTQAGSRTITATDTVTGSITGTSSTIAVSAAGASTLTVTAPASATAGTAFSTTVTALDTYGNTATGYTGTVHFTGGGIGATLPSDFTFTGGDSGTHTFTNGVTLTAAGNRAITATDTNTGSITGTSGAITVSPAGAATLTVAAPASATAGSAFSVTVTALDAYGNTATGYTGTVHFTGGGAGATLPSNYAFTGGDNGTHSFTNGATLTQAGNRSITATDTVTGSITGTSSSIAVGAASAHTIAIQAGDGQSATAGTAVATAPSALVTDQYGNPIAGTSVTFAVSTGGGNVTGGSQTTNASGIATVGSWTLGTATGANTLSATSTGLTGSPLTYDATATSDVATSFTLSATTTSGDVAGTADTLTITAHDQYGNVATGFGGSHDLTFAGATSIGGHQPTASDVLSVPQTFGTSTTLTFVAGTTTSDLTLYKAESASITATDSVDSISTPSPLGIGVVNAAAHTIAIEAGNNESATVGTPVSTAPSALVADLYGNPVAGVSVTFAAATGGGNVTGGAQTTNASGIATAGSWTLGTTAGANTLTATSTGLTGSPLTYDATATPDTTASLTVGAPASATAGTAFSVTVTAKDQYGNTTPAYTGTVHFTGGGAGATLPSDYTFTGGDNGTHTFTNGATLAAAGSRTITATDTNTGSITGTSGAIALAPAGASTLTVTAPGSATAGTGFAVTVTALDAYGNTATGYSGTVHFTGGGAGATLPSDYAFAGSDNGTHTFNGVTLAAAGSRTITATDTVTGSINGTSGAIAVSPAGASTLTVTAPASATAGTAFSVTVTAKDAYGNTATGYTGTVMFSGGGTGATLPSDYTFTGADNGTHTFTNGATLTQAGSRSMNAIDTVTGSITGTSGAIAVSSSSATALTVTAPVNATAGTAFSVTVTATDVYGNTATGYTGTVAFSGGGTGATLPSDYTFTGGDNGTHTFTNGATLTAAGNRAITATDTSTGSITGTSGTIAVSSAGATTLTVTAPANATAGSPFSATVTAKDAYGNTATAYTGTVHFTGGGTGATLPSNYTFAGGDNGTHTFSSAVTLTQAGNRALTATDTVTGSITGTSGTITVSAATLDVTVSTVGSSPASVTADGSTTSTITVTATDAYGNPIAGVTTSLSQGSGNSNISPASTSTDGTGKATFTVKDTTAETVSYQATVASSLLTQTTNVQFVPGAADGGTTTIDAAPTAMPADGTSTSTITVHAEDAQGNALTSSGGVVTLSTDHGSLSSVTDNGDGTYTATLTSSTSIETATVTGTIDGHSISAGATVSFTGVPSKYLVTSSDYAPAANTGVTITAQLADQADNPTGVAGKTITWSKTGPGGSFGSPTSVTNASGIATVTFTTGPSAPASYTVTATDDSTPAHLTGTSSAISTSVGGVSGADSTIGTAPASVPADGSTTSTVTVTLTDSLDNPIPGKTVTLSQPGGASSSISSASGPSDSNGHVTFTVSDLKGETVAYTATDTTDSVTLTHTASVTFVDSVPPTIAPAGPADGATGAGTVTLAASGVGDPGSGIASVTFFYCDSTASPCAPTSGTSISGVDAGGGNWTAALDTTSLVDGHSYSWVARAADNAGNHTDTAALALNVDNSTPSLTLGAPIPGTSPGSQYYDSSTQTVWLNSSDSGSFQLAANASDAQSGIADVRFSALLGTAVTNDATSPFQSAAYNFAPGSNSGTVNVTAFNGATVGTGANSATGSFTIAADSAAPGAFAVGAPADASKIGTGITVSAAPTDSQSGLRQVAFYYCDLSGGPCVPSIQIGLTQTVPAAGVYAVSWDTTGLTDGHTYAVDAVAIDNVGHTTTSTASSVTVDNSAPAVSVAAPAAVTGGAYQSYDASNKRLWLNASQAGSFKLRANATDADSGIASVTFPALLGTGANGGTLNGGVYESSTYTFNSPSAPGSQTITAANGVTNPAPETSTDSIDVEVDGNAPTTIQTFPVDNGSYQTGTWNGNCATSGICGTVTDAGSGVAQVNVSIKDRTTGKYWGGTAFDQSSQTFNAASVAGSNWRYALAESDLTSPHAYLVEIYAVDNVGNADVHQQFHFTFGNDTGGPSDTLSLTNATHAYLTATAPYVLYYGTTAGGGGFKLHASATDPSGVDTVTFPDLSGTSGFNGSGGTSTNGSNADPYAVDSPAYSFTGSATTAPAAKNIDSADLRGNVSHDQVTFVLDNTAPTGGSLSINGGNVYSTATSFAVSHTDYTLDGGGSGVASSVLTVASATLSNNACGTFGSPTPVSDGTFSGADATCYHFALTGTDNVGNTAATTFDVKVDTTAPSQPTITFGNLSAGNTYDDGAGTLYYRPSAGGTFRVDASSTDAESGVQSYTFSPLTGFSSTNQSGAALNATFSGSSTGGGAFTVHATNNAGLDSSDASYNVTADSTAPSGGSLTVNGTAATGAGSSSYLTSGGSVAVATTPYSDGGSGLASQVVTVQQATLSNDSCGTYGGTNVVGGASYGVANGNCYLFTITATDNVGNVTAAQTTVKVDTTSPVTPGISFTGASSGNTFVSGTTLYYRPSAGGTFTVNATGASDPETGIAGYTFSTLSGFTSATQTGNHVDVAFDGSSTGGGAFTVVANNNAGVSSTPATAFSITKDSTAPSGGLLSINPYSGSLSIAIAKTDFTDADSGIATNVVTRSNPQAPVGGACPVGGYTGANAVTLPNDTVPTDGACYQYTLTGTDNVGNAGTSSTNVLVDTTGPTGGSVSYADGPSSLNAISVDWDAGTDAESGIAQVRVDRATASISAGACGSLGGFSTIVASATVSPVVDSSVSAGNCYAYQIVVTNNAGVSSTFTSTSVTQLTTAVPFQIANTVPSGASLQGSTLYLGPAAANQPWQLQLTTDGGNGVTQATWQGKSGSPLSSAPSADSTPTSAPFNSGVYTWDGTPVNDTIQLTRDPGAQVDLVRVVSDLTDPTGSISYTNGTYASHSVHITTSASDADSGVASTQVQRASAPLTGATCGSWSGYSNITLNGGGNDTTVTDNTCYRYQLVVTDNVGNQFTAGSASVAQIPDTTPPAFVSAATNVAGTQLTVTMSEALDTAATTPASAFTLTYNGVAQPTPSGISISGSTVTLDLVNAPDNSQVVRVTYTQPSSAGDRVRDLATPTENETASFGPVAVANNTPDTVAPSVTSASVNGATVTLVFDEALAGAAPDPTAFTVTAGATGRAVTNVVMSGNVVTLTLASPVSSADTVNVAYAVPALNALHDGTGNTTAPFTRAAANQTPVVAPPAAAPVVVPAAPDLTSATPVDGATVRSVATISLDAGQAVTWTNMTVTRPDGTVTPLADASGSTWVSPFTGAAPGLYVVRGTISSGGQSVPVLSHFTIWTPNGTAIAPSVEKNASPDGAGELVSADGLTDVAWPVGAFNDEVVVDVSPHAATDFPAVPKTARVVSVTAFLRSTHAQVTHLSNAMDIRFANASATAHPVTSEDGKNWNSVPQLQTLTLGTDQPDGWFRDSDGTVHVLARHLSYYALVGPQSATTLALRLQTVRRLWLTQRSFIAVRFSVTMPARVTGNFVAADGTVVPGQTLKTPTRHAGVTIMRIPLRVTKPGVYRLQMRAEGGGQVVNRTATIRFLATKPSSPVWQTGALRVAVIRGAGALGALGSRLGGRFVVKRIADADLYRVVDAKSPTAAAAVVVDLSTVPLYTLVELHALLPEVQIVGLGGSPSRVAYYRSIGIATLLPHGASAKSVAAAVRAAVR